jgi:vanillate O-demethylase monooxygenase subunit
LGAEYAGKSEAVDYLIAYDFFLPGGIVLKTGTFPHGTADKYNGGRPDIADSMYGFAASTQTVTPTTKGKARYHFGVGGHVDKGGHELKERHFATAEEAFNEDLEIIEAQQKVIDKTNDEHPVLSAHDRANTLYTQMLKKVIRESA